MGHFSFLNCKLIKQTNKRSGKAFFSQLSIDSNALITKILVDNSLLLRNLHVNNKDFNYLSDIVRMFVPVCWFRLYSFICILYFFNIICLMFIYLIGLLPFFLRQFAPKRTIKASRVKKSFINEMLLISSIHLVTTHHVHKCSRRTENAVELEEIYLKFESLTML